MKPSRYNRVFQAQDGTWLAFNSWSTALAAIETEDLPFIRALLADPQSLPCDSPHKREIRELLVKARFLIEDDEDEIATLKVEILKDRFRTDLLAMTIAPTLDCNFRCDYCYEEHLRVTMSKAVQQALLSWVEGKAATIANLQVCWFGGEPMLPTAFPVVEDLSRGFLDLARSRGIGYRAEIVTNGYFLDRAKVDLLKSLGVEKVQITLDGPPVIHDRRRILLGGQGTFWRIVDNMKEIAGMIPIQLRINVDRRNAGATIDLLELLHREGIADKVNPYIAQVTPGGAACGNIVESCFNGPDFAMTAVDLYREAAKRSLPLSRFPFRIRGAYCTAERSNGFVIAPSGSVFRCWEEVTSNPGAAVGHLLDGEQPFHKRNESRWLAWNVFEKQECPTCDVLPSCHGGCPISAMSRPESPRGACEEFKFNLEPLLEIRHLYKPAQEPEAPPRGGFGASC
jgi:uncharacterized protein